MGYSEQKTQKQRTSCPAVIQGEWLHQALRLYSSHWEDLTGMIQWNSDMPWKQTSASVIIKSGGGGGPQKPLAKGLTMALTVTGIENVWIDLRRAVYARKSRNLKEQEDFV